MTHILIVTTFAGALLAAGTMASAQAVSQGSGYQGDLAAFHGDDQSLTKALRMIRMASISGSRPLTANPAMTPCCSTIIA
jgi:hypothetical protein